ncbi:MAG: LysM peptidoglycan-binding domain-containing protein [Chloroflexota bacterium]
MFERIKIYVFTTLLLTLLLSSFVVYAQPDRAPDFDTSPYDLINAVNVLRGAYGLPAYNINSILMSTAQNQADFMSATETVTHLGLDGINFTDRLLAAGYPLGGNLLAGGFRSENIMSGLEGTSAQDAVTAWMGDAPHQNTMLSQYLTEIGAGVAVVNGRVYFVIDCARPKTSAALPEGASIVESGAAIPANEAVINPVVQSTPNAAGDVIHEVQAGQTLWQIAIAYGVKIDDIKNLNNISDNNIYPGSKLLIDKVATPTVVPSIEIIKPEATATALPSATATPVLKVTATLMPIAPVAQNNTRQTASVIAIIALAILGSSIFVWLGKIEKDNESKR